MFRGLLIATALMTSAAVVAATPATATDAGDDVPWSVPSAPPRCSVDQAESGDVAGCLMAFWADPAETGWGLPPAPGVGPGWQWNGYTYSGSPALTEWESTTIASNVDETAGLAPGDIETHTGARALFEGFLREISARGYEVRDVGGYSFRCTAGNGGWSCPSGNTSDLSNHAWGLAIDMNADANPIRAYSGIDGASACLTPMDTDLPRWVIQVAEKWGLYWGGYGWNSGCAGTSTQRTSVYRDPPHFEFRGTPAQAAAIAAFNLADDPSRTCFDVVDDDGATAPVCNRSGRPEAGWRLPVQLDPPPGSVAAVVNLAVTRGARDGYVTLEDCGPKAGERQTSTITFGPDRTIATMAVVKLDADGRFCVYRSADAHTIVDVVAYLGTAEPGAAGQPWWFEPTTATRLTDTRITPACTPLQECRRGPVPDLGTLAVPATDPAPLIANLTVVGARQPGYAQAGQCDAVGPGQLFSNLNYSTDAARGNLVVIDGGSAGTCVHVSSETNVIVDELGRLSQATGYGWQLVPPRRTLDTRTCTASYCEGRAAAASVIPLDFATDAPAVTIAITMAQPERAGYLSVGPCDVLEGAEQAATSNLNYSPGRTTTNLALVELQQGRTCLFTTSAGHVIVDLQAELVPDRQIGMFPVTPYRVQDTRTVT